MFESLLNPKIAERKPSEMFFLAVALTIIASWLGIVIGKDSEVGHLIVAFICIGVAPLIVHLIWIDELKGEKRVGNLISQALANHSGLWILLLRGCYWNLSSILVAPTTDRYNSFCSSAERVKGNKDTRHWKGYILMRFPVHTNE